MPKFNAKIPGQTDISELSNVLSELKDALKESKAEARQEQAELRKIERNVAKGKATQKDLQEQQVKVMRATGKVAEGEKTAKYISERKAQAAKGMIGRRLLEREAQRTTDRNNQNLIRSNEDMARSFSDISRAVANPEAAIGGAFSGSNLATFALAADRLKSVAEAKFSKFTPGVNFVLEGSPLDKVEMKLQTYRLNKKWKEYATSPKYLKDVLNNNSKYWSKPMLKADKLDVASAYLQASPFIAKTFVKNAAIQSAKSIATMTAGVGIGVTAGVIGSGLAIVSASLSAAGAGNKARSDEAKAIGKRADATFQAALSAGHSAAVAGAIAKREAQVEAVKLAVLSESQSGLFKGLRAGTTALGITSPYAGADLAKAESIGIRSADASMRAKALGLRNIESNVQKYKTSREGRTAIARELLNDDYFLGELLHYTAQGWSKFGDDPLTGPSSRSQLAAQREVENAKEAADNAERVFGRGSQRARALRAQADSLAFEAKIRAQGKGGSTVPTGPESSGDNANGALIAAHQLWFDITGLGNNPEQMMRELATTQMEKQLLDVDKKREVAMTRRAEDPDKMLEDFERSMALKAVQENYQSRYFNQQIR